jgi:hypothetical protein
MEGTVRSKLSAVMSRSHAARGKRVEEAGLQRIPATASRTRPSSSSWRSSADESARSRQAWPSRARQATSALRPPFFRNPFLPQYPRERRLGDRADQREGTRPRGGLARGYRVARKPGAAGQGGPRAFVSLFVPYVLRQRRHIRRFLFSRFGVKVNYHSRIGGGDGKGNLPGLFGEQYVAVPERFPLRFWCCPEDYGLFRWYTAWGDLLYWFDGAWMVIVLARMDAARRGIDPDAAVVEEVFNYHRMGPSLIARPTSQTEIDPLVREEDAENLAGWVGSRIRVGTNKRLGAVLGEDLQPRRSVFERLVGELLPTTVIAFDDLRSEWAPRAGRRARASPRSEAAQEVSGESRGEAAGGAGRPGWEARPQGQAVRRTTRINNPRQRRRARTLRAPRDAAPGTRDPEVPGREGGVLRARGPGVRAGHGNRSRHRCHRSRAASGA